MMANDPVVQRALAAHTQAIKALMDHLEGHRPVPPDVVGDPKTCAVGRWLNGDGARHAELPEFAQAQVLHEDFHRAIGEILDLIDAGDQASALSLLRSGSAFASLSRRMLLAFETLSDAIAARQHGG